MTDFQEMISVIVPVYGVEKYLNRCIESITKQTYKNLEIILVDDGSPDHCPELCDEWAERDFRIRVIHKANGGLSDARNAGMKAATGAYIGFVDSDDWIDPQMYERLVIAMKRNQCDIAACGVKMVWESGLSDRILIMTPDCVLNRKEAQKALLEENLIKQPVWYKLYKTDCIKHVFFDVGYCHEDVLWSYRAIGAAEKVSLIEHIGYYYFQRKDSIMGVGYSLKRLDALKGYCRRYAYMKTEFPELADMALKAIWSRCIYEGQQAMLHLSKKETDKVFRLLSSVRRRYPIQYSVYADDKLSHRMWMSLSRISLRTTCRVRNLLNIGF